MKKFYEKNEIWFAVIFIIVYVVGTALADMFSDMIGVGKSITVAYTFALSIFLAVWIFKNGLKEKYGLIAPEFNFKKDLFYLPLLVLISINFFFGARLNANALETVLYVLSMLAVGFLEEVIFRGLLFKAMAKDNLKVAVIVSSLTFGIGHVVNLITGNGAVVATILQIIYATAVGFLFVIIFLKGGSLLPCIIAHALVNASSIFSAQDESILWMQLVTAGVTIVVAAAYSVYLIKARKE